MRRAVLNKPWLKPGTYLDSDGRSHVLEPDQYIERGTGLVRRRTAEEQVGFEKVEQAKWQSARLMEQIRQEHAEGKIDDRRLAELQSSYRARNPFEPWWPVGYGAPPASAPNSEDADETAQDAPHPTTPADAEKVLASVAPVAVTATGSVTETFADWGDVVTTLELAFWNLGTLSPGHGKAVLKITSSYDGSFALVGTFSGGPTGTLTFIDAGEDGSTLTFRVEGGTHVVGEVERLINNGTATEMITLVMPLSDPSAFEDWPSP